MQPHRIRLRGPWEVEWVSRSDGVAGRKRQRRPGTSADRKLVRGHEDSGPATPETARVEMPAEWRELFGSQGGRVRFRRRFNKPTNLETAQRVFLVLGGVGGTGEVRLNARELGQITGEHPTLRFEITGLLQTRNDLVVELTFHPDENPDKQGGLWGLVALEIHEK